MTWTRRRGERVVAGAVAAVFVGFAALGLVIDGPPASEHYVSLVVALIWLITPSVLAARMLWRAWWDRAGASLSTLDPPAQLLAAAVATLPDDRRDWGAGMAAELAQVRDRAARWRFAAGCARVAVFPPHDRRVPVLPVAALATAAVVVAALTIGDAFPSMRTFTVTFVAIIGALTTLAVTRARGLRRPAAGPTITVAGLPPARPSPWPEWSAWPRASPSPVSRWCGTRPTPSAGPTCCCWRSCWPAACG